jgi:hypothetical protein
MALVNCETLCGLASPDRLQGAGGLPDPAALGLSSGLPGDLAAYAGTQPAGEHAAASAGALAAVPVASRGKITDRGGALLARARDRVRGAGGQATGSAEPVGHQEAAAAATRLAAADAQAQGAAIEAAVRATLAQGGDSAAMTQAAEAFAGTSTPAVQAMIDQMRAGIAARGTAPQPDSSATPPVADQAISFDRWGVVKPATPPAPAAQPQAAGDDAGYASLPNWGRISAAPPPETAGAAAPVPLAMPMLVPARHNRQAAAITSAWQSLRQPPLPPAPVLDGPWTIMGSDARTPPLALADVASRIIPDPEPLPGPPFDCSALAALGSTVAMFRSRFGYSLARPGAVSDLAETIESFNDCTAGQEPIDPDMLEALTRWGGLARGIGAVRDQMGVDLLRPDAGPQFSHSVADPLGSSVAWQEQRAQAIMNWMPLDQAASALDMPVSGDGALTRLGRTLRTLADAELPDLVNPWGANSLLAALDQLQAIAQTFGVDALSPDAAGPLSAIGRRVAGNLAGRMDGSAPMPTAFSGLTHASLDRFACIDRSQASELGLAGLDAMSSPVMTAAPPVLGILNAGQVLSSAAITRPGRG